MTASRDMTLCATISTSIAIAFRTSTQHHSLHYPPPPSPSSEELVVSRHLHDPASADTLCFICHRRPLGCGLPSSPLWAHLFVQSRRSHHCVSGIALLARLTFGASPSRSTLAHGSLAALPLCLCLSLSSAKIGICTSLPSPDSPPLRLVALPYAPHHAPPSPPVPVPPSALSQGSRIRFSGPSAFFFTPPRPQSRSRLETSQSFISNPISNCVIAAPRASL